MEGVRSHISNEKQLQVLYFNARSLTPKLDELCVLCDLRKPNIVCITESWLCEDIGPSECSIHGHHCVRCDRHRHGGGVALFISDLLESHVILCGPSSQYTTSQPQVIHRCVV